MIAIIIILGVERVAAAEADLPLMSSIIDDLIERGTMMKRRRRRVRGAERGTGGRERTEKFACSFPAQSHS